ncbi:dual adapter for phosphotyrosine and 3-phosphotyrosine and 3-phosphoinositide isoform X3 [Anser cygnoides]|uniref:dual adapter for phosphotyrosine and 3-phosphotyrosine and 3-phosphoinositide isoform X3 n=1 Tax=Anser cygnoides TaxID=8845 RepID=UPI0034D1A675
MRTASTTPGVLSRLNHSGKSASSTATPARTGCPIPAAGPSPRQGGRQEAGTRPGAARPRTSPAPRGGHRGPAASPGGAEAMTERREPRPAARLDEELQALGWYHDNLTRHAAEALLLSNGQDGSYLLRKSNEREDLYSLSVRGKDSVKHFHVEHTGSSFKFGFNEFSSLKELVMHFANQPLIGSETGFVSLELVVCLKRYTRLFDQYLNMEGRSPANWSVEHSGSFVLGQLQDCAPRPTNLVLLQLHLPFQLAAWINLFFCSATCILPPEVQMIKRKLRLLCSVRLFLEQAS